jgi:branched-chain amino acid transport system permease protein
MIFSLIIDGLAVGSIYSLVAVGLVMLFKSTGALNFAHGDFMMFYAFVAYTFLIQFNVSFFITIVGTLLFACVLGIVVERTIIRKLINIGGPTIIMVTLGLGYILRGIAGIIWTNDVFSFPKLFSRDLLYIGNIPVPSQNIMIIVSTIIIISILYLFLNYTKIGTGLRALTQNKTAATLMGVRLRRMYSLSWAIAGMLAAFAGILLAPTLFLSTGMGSITFTAIIATIIGGFGNIFGAVIGGYLLGVLQSVIPLYIPTELQGIIPFVLLIVVLFLKPTGILGKKTIKKV